MNIVMTVPAMAVPHGGIRVILEWANWLSQAHEVTLFCRKGISAPTWMAVSPRVKIISNERSIKKESTLVICSPHDIELAENENMPERKFIFLQMLEHLFHPTTKEWVSKCIKTYACTAPLISISQWNIDFIKKHYSKGDRKIYYIGNGVNSAIFPIEKNCKKDGKCVLVEGWETKNNPTKDVDAIGPQIAQRLRDEGYRILAYSQYPIQRNALTPHEYYFRPSTTMLNSLYRRATVLIKASRYDARACSPIEAMTKECVTVRGIIRGDDDLIHDENCFRHEYDDVDILFSSAMKLLTDSTVRDRLKENCIEYVRKHSWGYWMPQVEEILANG
jgi:hypothetical protein